MVLGQGYQRAGGPHKGNMVRNVKARQRPTEQIRATDFPCGNVVGGSTCDATRRAVHNGLYQLRLACQDVPYGEVRSSLPGSVTIFHIVCTLPLYRTHLPPAHRRQLM